MRCPDSSRLNNMSRLGLALALALPAVGLLAVIYLFPPEHFSFYPQCLFHALTGLQCPSCGGLRAVHYLLHGEITTALSLNPLLVLAGPILLLAICLHGTRRKSARDPIGRHHHPIWIWLLAAGILLFGIGRNLVSLFLRNS